MAKKKKSPFQQLIKTPVSFKNVSLLIVGVSSIVWINMSTISRSYEKKRVKPIQTISQNQLQNVLGESISFGDAPTKDKNHNSDQITTYWQNILSIAPNYRDAYLILAVQSFNKHNCESTKWYMDKAITLDQNNPALPDLLKKMQKCLGNV